MIPDAAETPSCSKCDADMIRRMDMETARWFWDCPNECDRAKPVHKKRKKPDDPALVGHADAVTSDGSVIDYKTGAFGVVVGANASRPLPDGLSIGSSGNQQQNFERRMSELDARQAEIERRLSARRGSPAGAGGAITLAGGTGGSGIAGGGELSLRAGQAPAAVQVGPTPPQRGSSEGTIYYDTTTGSFRVMDASGNPSDITVHPSMTCPAVSTNKDGTTKLCGRPTEVLGGKPHEHRLCWVHGAPVDATPGPRAKTRLLLCLLIAVTLAAGVAGPVLYFWLWPIAWAAPTVLFVVAVILGRLALRESRRTTAGPDEGKALDSGA